MLSTGIEHNRFFPLLSLFNGGEARTHTTKVYNDSHMKQPSECLNSRIYLQVGDRFENWNSTTIVVKMLNRKHTYDLMSLDSHSCVRLDILFV